jgi:hypothetical protein
MIFYTQVMLFGLAAVAIPIIIHLLNRRKAKVIHWGAMQFLMGSLVYRSRRMLIEEMLLLAVRCLLLALLALAMARPFIPPGSKVPWAAVLPAVLLGAVAMGVGTAMWQHRRARWTMYAAGLSLLLLAVVLSAAEHWLQLRRWVNSGGRQDVAIVLDASASMTVMVDGQTRFDQAVEEARAVIASLSPTDAVTILVGDAAPSTLLRAPSVDRRLVSATLDALKPVGGAMAPLDALNAAALALSEGQAPLKKIVIITDGQSVGWVPEAEARWEFLARSLQTLPATPRIICRILPMPKVFRNAAITQLALSREVIGPDRPVRINVQVENTGTELLNAFEVSLRVNRETTLRKPITPLTPGTVETVSFMHQFATGGLQTLEAELSLNDDLAADNAATRVVRTVERLPVLVVDGNPAPHPLQRASAFIGLALAPGVYQANSGPPPRENARSGEKAQAVLVEPTVVAASEVAGLEDLQDFYAVILADVPQLPGSVAERLVAYVHAGGGLLIAPGSRARPAFYNGWRQKGGRAFLPARLSERKAIDNPEQTVRLAVSTFTHQALMLLADDAQSDADLARLNAWWHLAVEADDANVSTGGLIDTGDPLLVERRLGEGRVLLTAVSLDSQGSNLATLQAFVPLVHEMVHHLVRPTTIDHNYLPSARLAIRLSPDGAGAGQGLRADCYAKRNFSEMAANWISSALDFKVAGGKIPEGLDPANIAIRWTGSLVPRYTDKYTLVATGQEKIALTLDGKRLLSRSGAGAAQAVVELQQGMPHDLVVEFIPGGPEGQVRLEWFSRRQKREIIPAECLSPLRPWRERLTRADQAKIVAPDGTSFTAELMTQNEHLEVHVRGAIGPGLYRATLPDLLTASFGHGFTPQGDIPFTIQSVPQESRLSLVSETEWEAIDRSLPLFRTHTTEDTAKAVVGGIPGQHLWRYLALAALIAVISEIALSRWIAAQRKTGAVKTVDFTSGAADPTAYRERLRRVMSSPLKESPRND